MTASLPPELIDPETRTHLQELFSTLKQDVEIHTFVRAQSAQPQSARPAGKSNGNGKSNGSANTGAEALNDPHVEAMQEQELFDVFTVRLCRELAGTSARLHHVEHVGPLKSGASPESAQGLAGQVVTLLPSILICAKGGSRPVLRMTGAPLGEEARALVQGILLAGTGESGLSDSSRAVLAELKEPRHIRVFSSPGCPYCPGQVLNAFRAAMERPDLVTAECVTSDEFPELAHKYGVGSVPHTQFSENHSTVGLMAEAMFVYETVHLAPMPAGMADSVQAKDVPTKDLDLVILGGGPAGLSAAIYAARSGLKTVLLEQVAFGGQVTVTPVVENYPAFSSIKGQQLAEIMADHARQYVPLLQGVLVQGVTREGDQISVHTPDAVYQTRALLFATGAEWKDMGVPGEDRLRGKGVVHCASCDGYLFKGKDVVVVGGGNTALTDALHLKNLGVAVTIMHRRDAFRAESALQKAVERAGIPVLWNSTPVEVQGSAAVQGLRVKNTATGEESTLKVNGVFVAVGQKPNTELAVPLGVELTATGSIKVDEHHRTSVPGVYAAGDVCGGVQQIVTAVSAGAQAAITVFEDLQKL